jgi:hypothetical protein
MKKVEVPWFDQRSGATFSMELSQWCEEQGLINGVDYKWHFVPDQKVSVFYFDDSLESYTTLFALRWSGTTD